MKTLTLVSKIITLLFFLSPIGLTAQTNPQVQTCNNDGGSITIAGAFDGELELAGTIVEGSLGSSGIFVARISPSGQLLWTTLLVGYDSGTDIHVGMDSQGRAILTLTYTASPVDTGGDNVSVISLDNSGTVSFVVKGSIPIGG